jgi:hypothetical protein
LLSTDVAVLVVAVTMEATPVTAPLAEVQQMDERPKQPKKLKDEAANAIRMEEWRHASDTKNAPATTPTLHKFFPPSKDNA